MHSSVEYRVLLVHVPLLAYAMHALPGHPVTIGKETRNWNQQQNQQQN